MSNPATLSFSRNGTALFTSDEIRALMQIEFERAQRYSYPVVCLLIQIDRLQEIQTIHGFESKGEVFAAVIELIKGETRDGDLLGTVVDDRLMALIPHTTPEAAKSLTTRILNDARGLVFAIPDRTIRITLSIGLSHNQDPGATSIATLERVAEEGLSVADASGGDRYVETELYQLYERERAPVSREDIEELLQRAEQMGYRKRLELLVADGADLETAADTVADEVIGRAVEAERLKWQTELESVSAQLAEKAAAPTPQDPGTFKREIEQLQRRIAKLTGSLETTEQEITRLRSLKGVEDGVASVYRDVQGLESSDARSEMKDELMGEIFRANLHLQGKRTA